MKTNRWMRMLFVSIAVVGMLSPTIALQADPCVRDTRIIKTYWGWYGQYGPICGTLIIGPPPAPNTKQMIGQEVWACDGTYETWGMTDCGDYTIEETICGEC